MSVVGIEIRGLRDLQEALDKLEGRELKSTLQKITAAGGKAIKPYVVVEAPRGPTGRLKKSVSARKAKRDLPASVVSPRPSVAYYRHMVIGGTKRGQRANPFVARGYERGDGAAIKAVEDEIERYLRSL